MTAPATFGWPDVMLTARAAEYTGRSRWTITRAVRAGELKPIGRRGISLTFERLELDRWMRGTPVDPAAPTLDRNRHASTSDLAESMRRIRAAGKGRK